VLQHVSFSLQSNSSTDWFKGHYQHPNTYLQLPLQMAAERETARHLANGPFLPFTLFAPATSHANGACCRLHDILAKRDDARVVQTAFTVVCYD